MADSPNDKTKLYVTIGAVVLILSIVSYLLYNYYKNKQSEEKVDIPKISTGPTGPRN